MPVLTDIHEAWQAAAGRRGRGRPADSRVPLAADGPDRGGGPDRARRQREEGPVPGAARHAPRHREGPRVGQRPRVRHRARVLLRLQQPGRRHARVSDDARPRRAGRLRRHPQPAAAGRRRRRHRGARRVHRAAGARGRRAPASTACSWKCTRSRRAPRATRRTRWRSTSWRRCSISWCGSTRSRKADRRQRSVKMTRSPQRRLDRPGAQRARDRGAGDSRADPPARPDVFRRARPAPGLHRPRHRHRHGQVRHHRAQDSRRRCRAPAPPPRSSTRPRRCTAISASCSATTS